MANTSGRRTPLANPPNVDSSDPKTIGIAAMEEAWSLSENLQRLIEDA